jgi:hypothetical protein
VLVAADGSSTARARQQLVQRQTKTSEGDVILSECFNLAVELSMMLYRNTSIDRSTAKLVLWMSRAIVAIIGHF